MKLEDFAHIQLIQDKEVKFKTFSEELKLNLSSFEKSFKTFLIKKDPVILNELKARSSMLAQYIFNYFVEEETAPVPDPEPPAPEPPVPPAPTRVITKNEQALINMFDNGITEKITPAILNQHGFDTGFNTPLGRKGCRVGDYELQRVSETYYKLVKLT